MSSFDLIIFLLALFMFPFFYALSLIAINEIVNYLYAPLRI